MHIDRRLCFTILGLVVVATEGTPVLASDPGGSYAKSCKDVRTSGSTLLATCRTRGGAWVGSQLTDYGRCVGDISNQNGVLTCDKPPAPSPAPVCPSGSFSTMYAHHGCHCPAGQAKYYSGIGNSQATCSPPRTPPTCPASGTFKTDGTYRGCDCPNGGTKLYSGWFSSEATCRTSAPVYTGFRPETNGFRFENPAACGVGGTNGCCTGMSWAAIDFFASGRTIPNGASIANYPGLFAWIVAATNSGVVSMLPTWGANWAAHTADFEGVMSSIDRHVPVPLGLLTNEQGALANSGSNHSVVAYGYAVPDAKSRNVYVYDVDEPGVWCTLFNVQESSGERWHEECSNGAADPEGSWLGFFVEEPFEASYRQGHPLPAGI